VSAKERVRTALAHEAPVDLPIDLGSTAVTGIHVSCVAALRDYYGLEKRPVKIHEPYQLLGLVEEDLMRATGAPRTASRSWSRRTSARPPTRTATR
jgi:hypothetical protein